MPPKQRAEPDRRITRSAQAKIPDNIPLPPTRNPPTRKKVKLTLGDKEDVNSTRLNIVAQGSSECEDSINHIVPPTKSPPSIGNVPVPHPPSRQSSPTVTAVAPLNPRRIPPRPIPPSFGKPRAPLTRDEEDDLFIIKHGKSRSATKINHPDDSHIQKATKVTQITKQGFRFRRASIHSGIEGYDDNDTEATWPSPKSPRAQPIYHDSPAPDAARNRCTQREPTPMPDAEFEDFAKDPQETEVTEPRNEYEQTPIVDDEDQEMNEEDFALGMGEDNIEKDIESLETNEEDKQAEEEDGNLGMDVDGETMMRPTTPHESDPSGSDYSETEKDAQRRRIGHARYRRNLTPTIEDQDQEDEQEFNEVPRTPRSPPRFTRRQKGKGKEPDGPAMEEFDSFNNARDTLRVHATKKKSKSIHQSRPRLESPDPHHALDADNEDESTGPYSSGPIPSDAKQAAFAAHEEFLQKLDDIAKQCGKPIKHFLSLVGQEVPSTRRLSAWDAYQRWYPTNVEKKPDNMSAPNWVKYVSTKYKEDLDRLKANIGSDKPSAKDIEKHFEKQFTFYRKTLEKYLVAKREEKKFSAVVSRALNPFIRMSTQVYEETGIHVFGFAVETTPDSCSSVAWGGSNEYKQLRKSHKTIIQTQIHDYEGLFKVAEMRTRDLGAASLKSVIDLREKPNEPPRDYLRRLLGEFLRSDLARIFVERDDSTTSEEIGKIKMNWQWTDYAYKNELRIISWEKGAVFPKDKFMPKKLPHNVLKVMVNPRIDSYNQFIAREGTMDDDEEDLTGLVHIISWTEDEQKLPLKEKCNIALVVDVDGTTLSSVLDCDAYVRSLQAIGEISQKNGPQHLKNHTRPHQRVDTAVPRQKPTKNGPSNRHPNLQADSESDIGSDDAGIQPAPAVRQNARQVPRYYEIDNLESDGGSSVVSHPKRRRLAPPQASKSIPARAGVRPNPENLSSDQIPSRVTDRIRSVPPQRSAEMPHDLNHRASGGSNRHSELGTRKQERSSEHQQQLDEEMEPPCNSNQQIGGGSNQDNRHTETGIRRPQDRSSEHQQREAVGPQLHRRAPPLSNQHNHNRMHSIALAPNETSRHQDERLGNNIYQGGNDSNEPERRFGPDLYQNHHLRVPDASMDHQIGHYDQSHKYQYFRQFPLDNNSRQPPGPPPINYPNHPPQARNHGPANSGPLNTSKPPSRSTVYHLPTSNHVQVPVWHREEEQKEEPRVQKKRKIDIENDYRPTVPLPARGRQVSHSHTQLPTNFQQGQHSVYPDHSVPYTYGDSQPRYYSSGNAISGSSHRPNYQYENEFYDGNYHNDY